MPKRSVAKVYIPETNEIKSFYETVEDAVGRKFTQTHTIFDYSFCVFVKNTPYVRSVLSVDKDTKEVTFYCDIAVGDELYLVNYTNEFVSKTEKDFEDFLRDKNGTLIGGILCDCVTRRLRYAKDINKLITFPNGFQHMGNNSAYISMKRSPRFFSFKQLTACHSKIK